MKMSNWVTVRRHGALGRRSLTYIGLLLAMAGCMGPPTGMTVSGSTQARYRVEFVKVTTPWWRAVHPDAVVGPDVPMGTVEFLRMVDRDPDIAIVQHVDAPAKDSWTKCEVGFDNLEDALAYRKSLTEDAERVGTVMQVRILARGEK